MAVKIRWLRSWLPITLILLLATGLYLYQLDTESLWLDEAFSIKSAQGALNLNRPLYFLLLRGWMLFGTREVWLRGLSVLFGLGTVFLIYRLGCRLSSQTTGLIAALLLALSALAIDLSQEVRMYMMSTCLGLGGSLALSAVLDSQSLTISSLSWWIIWRFLGILTTPINMLLLLPDGILLGAKIRKQIRPALIFRRWFWLLGIAIVPAALTLADVVPPFLELLHGVSLPPPELASFVGGLTRFTAWPLEGPRELAGFYDPFFNLYALMNVGLLSAVLFNQPRSTQLFRLAAWGFLPLVAIFLLAQLFPSLWRERYFWLAAPYILILLAQGFVKIWNWQRLAALLVAVIYAIAVSGTLVRYYTVQDRLDWRGLAQTVYLNQQPGDAIVVYPDFYLPVVEYYYHGPAPVYPIDNAWDELTAQQKMLSLISANRRFWLIYPLVDEWGLFQKQILATLVARGFALQQIQTATESGGGVGVALSLVTSSVASQNSL
jgi:4-amino-4-deoxy-L-arabinose transferase-like glycosyltransferase